MLLPQVAGRAIKEQASVQERDLAEVPPEGFEVVRHVHYCQPALLDEPLKEIQQFQLRDRVHTCCRLVQQQQLGLAGQRSRRHHALVLAPRQLPDQSVAKSGHPNRVQRTLHRSVVVVIESAKQTATAHAPS